MIQIGHEQNQSTQMIQIGHEQNQSSCEPVKLNKSPLVGTASLLDELIELEENDESIDSISIYSGELMDFGHEDESSSEDEEYMDTTDSELEIVSVVKPPLTKCSVQARAESISSLQSTQQGLSNAIRGFIQMHLLKSPNQMLNVSK
jgi:hypothetical protein